MSTILEFSTIMDSTLMEFDCIFIAVAGKMNSSCEVDRCHVMNVDEIDFRQMASHADPVNFMTRHDHSKWAVSTLIRRKDKREVDRVRMRRHLPETNLIQNVRHVMV